MWSLPNLRDKKSYGIESLVGKGIGKGQVMMHKTPKTNGRIIVSEKQLEILFNITTKDFPCPTLKHKNFPKLHKDTAHLER